MKTITVVAGLAAGNFFWQAAFHSDAPDWSIAFERSYFQLIAIYALNLVKW